MKIFLLAVEELYKDSKEPHPTTNQPSTLKKEVRPSQGPQSKSMIVLPRIRLLLKSQFGKQPV